MVQMAEHLTCKQKVIGSNPDSCWPFFFEVIPLLTRVFAINFWDCCNSASNHLWRVKLNARHLGTRILLWFIDISFYLVPQHGWREMTYWKLSNIPVKATDKHLKLLGHSCFFFQLWNLFDKLFLFLCNLQPD